MPFPLSPRPKVGEPAELRPGISFNKSFPRCVFSRSQIHFVRLLFREAHISVKKKRWLWHTSAFSGKNIYYRSDPLLPAETLVTVSPCEFPPRCLPRILPCHPRDPSCHPREGEDPLALSLVTPVLFLTNLSLDVYLPSRADSLRSTALSGSTHLGQKTSVGSGIQVLFRVRIFTIGPGSYNRRKLL